MAKNSDIRCSFCNKPQDQVRKMIAGPAGVYICDECVGLCSNIIEEEFDEDSIDDEDIMIDETEIFDEDLATDNLMNDEDIIDE